jgi:hypothetical protein
MIDSQRLVAPCWTLGAWGLAGALLISGYPVRALNGAVFSEEIRTEALTRVETAERRRVLRRDTRFGITVRGDTVIVSADSVALSELADGTSRTLDTDGFTGGRYRLTLDASGRATLWLRPFVPDDIAEVSDLGRAMDDFFPLLPPDILPSGTDSTRDDREWRRLADSGGVQRFRWTEHREREATQSVADSVSAQIVESTRDEGTLAWSVTRGPLAWTRHIASDVTTRLRGRTIRATVVQQIEVRRVR